MQKKYSLVLWGWAARWLAHIGVLKYLEEKNVNIQELAWTSMGAIIASFVAIWKTSDEIKDFAKNLNFLKLIDPSLKTGLLKWKKVEEKLKEVFGETKIEETKIPLKIIATNIEKSQTKIFTKWKIIDAVRASLSLPWIFVPKNIDWEDYVDGGVMMNLPIEAVEWNDVIAVSALKINSWKIVKDKKILWLNIKTGFWKNNYEIIKRSIVLMMEVNEQKSLKTPNKNIKFIRPNFWELDIMHFNKVDEFCEIWYKEAKKLEI
jgi:predicted acylesterase/phospholipase RssA